MQTEGGTSLQLSVSIGVAAFQPHRHHDADALYHAADTALYEIGPQCGAAGGGDRLNAQPARRRVANEKGGHWPPFP